MNEGTTLMEGKEGNDNEMNEGWKGGKRKEGRKLINE